MEQYIENLKSAENAPIIGLNSKVFLSPPIFKGVKINPILPNFTRLWALVSERSKDQKFKTFLDNYEVWPITPPRHSKVLSPNFKIHAV